MARTDLSASEEDPLTPESEAELDDLASLLRGGIGHLLPRMDDVLAIPQPDRIVDDPVLEAASEEYRSLVAEHGRTAWFPTWRAGDDDHPVTKCFGAPWTADGVVWPRLGGRDALFVLQIDLGTLPAAAPKVLGGKGLLQVFMADPEVGAVPDEAWTVRLARPHLRRGRNRVGPVPWSRRPSVSDGWTERFDVPSPAVAAALGTDDAVLSDLASRHGIRIGELGPLRGDKLGGWTVRSVSDPRRIPFFLLDGRPASPSPVRGLLGGDGTALLLVDPKGASAPTVATFGGP